MNYCFYLDAMGRPEDAVTHMRRALQLDPRSFLMNRQMGAVLYFARRYDEALTYLQRAIEIEPSRFHYAQGWITHIYEMTLRSDDAERSDLLMLGIRVPAAKLAPLRLAYQRGGWKAYQAARIELIAKQPNSGCDLYEVGEGYLRLGTRIGHFPGWPGVLKPDVSGLTRFPSSRSSIASGAILAFRRCCGSRTCKHLERSCLVIAAPAVWQTEWESDGANRRCRV